MYIYMCVCVCVCIYICMHPCIRIHRDTEEEREGGGYRNISPGQHSFSRTHTISLSRLLSLSLSRSLSLSLSLSRQVVCLVAVTAIDLALHKHDAGRGGFLRARFLKSEVPLYLIRMSEVPLCQSTDPTATIAKRCFRLNVLRCDVRRAASWVAISSRRVFSRNAVSPRKLLHTRNFRSRPRPNV